MASRFNGIIRRASHQSLGKVFAMQDHHEATPPRVGGEVGKRVVMRSPCAARVHSW